jgi:hypothetical protein
VRRNERKPPDSPAKVDWHRLFGLLLMDFFTGSPYEVETEIDLSLDQQFLGVVIVRKTKGKLKDRPPDGLDDLVAPNLISFKSHHEPLRRPEVARRGAEVDVVVLLRTSMIAYNAPDHTDFADTEAFLSKAAA